MDLVDVLLRKVSLHLGPHASTPGKKTSSDRAVFIIHTLSNIKASCKSITGMLFDNMIYKYAILI